MNIFVLFRINQFTRSDETLFRQFKGETSRYFLQFMNGILLWIEFQTGFGTTEWYIDTSALERHQS